jgi:hypothetical protein
MKQYWLQFGSGDPRNYTGLTPSLVIFKSFSGVALTAPGLTEPISGSGLYKFEYNPSFSIAFLADGSASISASGRYIAGVLDPSHVVDERVSDMGATVVAIGSSAAVMGNSLAVMGGSLSVMGGSLVAMGNTLAAIGLSAGVMGTSLSALGSTVMAIGSSLTAIDAKIGTTASSFGDTLTDPGTIYGHLKRIQEHLEGNATFNKSSGLWYIYSRGSSTMLRAKTLANTSSQATKT